LTGRFAARFRLAAAAPVRSDGRSPVAGLEDLAQASLRWTNRFRSPKRWVAAAPVRVWPGRPIGTAFPFMTAATEMIRGQYNSPPTLLTKAVGRQASPSTARFQALRPGAPRWSTTWFARPGGNQQHQPHMAPGHARSPWWIPAISSVPAAGDSLPADHGQSRNPTPCYLSACWKPA